MSGLSHSPVLPLARDNPAPPDEPALRRYFTDDRARGAWGRRSQRREWDAIVVGAGASGGLAALLLARAGLDVLVLDAGWSPGFWRSPVRAALTGGVPRAMQAALFKQLPAPARALGRLVLRAIGRVRQPVQSTCLAWEQSPSHFVDDRDAPYETGPDAPFHWIRGWQVGGRMVVPNHGRQYCRMSAAEFAGDGEHGSWPLGAADLEPWYDRVEDMLGLQGHPESVPGLPDSRLALRVPYTPADLDVINRLRARWPAIQMTLGRSAPPLPALAMAMATGRVTCRQGAVAREILTDRDGDSAGVAWFDRAEGGVRQARARLVFLAASALESARILMLSRSSRHPLGLGGGSGALGRYLMDHLLVSGGGTGPGIDAPPGAPPLGHCVFIPRMDQRDPGGADERGSYGMQVYRWAATSRRASLNAVSFSSMAPRPENRVTLHPWRRDAFGSPVLRIDCRPNGAEIATAARQSRAIAELAAMCGVKMKWLDAGPPIPGAAVHEGGVARMGLSPDASVLDPFNECWDAPGLFVTDAAAFPSLPLHSPTLTSMALTARAVDHALRSRLRPGVTGTLPAWCRAQAA